MSIVRVGLAETNKFAEGWEAIFGKKKKEEPAKKPEKAPTGKKKTTSKKKS